MTLFTIAWRSMRRKWLRSCLLALLFSLGALSVVCLATLADIVAESLEKKLVSFGANILVSPKRDTLRISYGGIPLDNLAYEAAPLDLPATLSAIRGIHHAPRISAVAPKRIARKEVNGQPVGLVGVDWKEELNLKQHWIPDVAFPKDAGEILAGSEAAKRLGLTAGGRVTLGGTAFAVSGVLEATGGEDDQMLFADIAAVQTLTGKPGSADFVEVAALCAGCPIDDIVNQIAAALPGMEVKALKQVVEQRMASMRFVGSLLLGVSVVILLTACAMIGLSMLSAVNERVKDIGILRSLGYAKSRIFLLFAFEAGVLGALAGLLGALGGHVLTGRLVVLLELAEASAVVFQPALALGCVAGFGLLAMLSATAPALKAARVDPSTALLHV